MSTGRGRATSARHDASYKGFFAQGRTVTDALLGAAHELARHLDFSTLERLPASFVTEHLGQRHADKRWTSAKDICELFGPVPAELLGYLPRHRYLLIDVQKLDPAALPAESVLAMIARLEQASTAAAVQELVAPLADLLGEIGEPELEETFRAWIRLVVLRRFGSKGRELTRKLEKEEGGQMTTLLDRARKWGEERDQKWLQKGIERGRREGVERGRIEGERELVRRMVIRRFGPGTAEQLLPLLDDLSDPESIAAVVDAVVESQTGEEFLKRVCDA